MMNQLQAMYYALTRRVPRWLMATVLAVMFTFSLFAIILTAYFAPVIFIIVVLTFIIGVIAHSIYEDLPTDSRKRKEEE